MGAPNIMGKIPESWGYKNEAIGGALKIKVIT
jgi:hypothetical protein